MTYISRRSRIIVSRYVDGRDSENALRLCRKRSEGRLKRFISCDDVRAWINNSCINYEHFLDLMSDGESKKNVCGRLYGRFIPVPFLIKLFQPQIGDTKDANGENDTKDPDLIIEDIKLSVMEMPKKDPINLQEPLQEEEEVLPEDVNVRQMMFPKKGPMDQSDILPEDVNVRQGVFPKSQPMDDNYENFIKEYGALLNKALNKLEKIDKIVFRANCDFENARKEEIQELFQISRDLCCCSTRSSRAIEPNAVARSSARRLRGTPQSSALLKKISGLQEELKRIQAISDHFQCLQQRPCEPSSFPQVTELYNRKHQAICKKPRKKYEKLLAKKGRILTEICDDLRNLSNLKKASRSSMSFRRRSCIPDGGKYGDVEENGVCYDSFNNIFSDIVENSAAKYGYSVTSSTDFSVLEDGLKKSKQQLQSDEYMFNASEMSNGYDTDDLKTENTDPLVEDTVPYVESPYYSNESKRESKQRYSREGPPSPREESNYQPDPQADYPQKFKDYSENSLLTETTVFESGTPNSQKSGKVKKKERNSKEFCKKNFPLGEAYKRGSYLDNLEKFQRSFSPRKSSVEERCRPQTAPKPIRRESFETENRKNSGEYHEQSENLGKNEASVIMEGSELNNTSEWNETMENRPQRKIKSETTMKEIEKALRNYEQRLNCVETLDYRVEEMKQKLWESCRYKKQVASERAKSKKLQAVERQCANKKMMNLCSENMELKKQIEELTATCETQCEKIQNLKYNANRTRELECETEMLKKELSGYRENLDYQRKCLTDWENVVAAQRTEIQNLENQLKNLTMLQSREPVSMPEKRNHLSQRSRSCSPHPQNIQPCRPKSPVRRIKMSDEDDVICCYDRYAQNDDMNMAMTSEGVYNSEYCPPPQNRQAQMQWYYK